MVKNRLVGMGLKGHPEGDRNSRVTTEGPVDTAFIGNQ